MIQDGAVEGGGHYGELPHLGIPTDGEAILPEQTSKVTSPLTLLATIHSPHDIIEIPGTSAKPG